MLALEVSSSSMRCTVGAPAASAIVASGTTLKRCRTEWMQFEQTETMGPTETETGPTSRTVNSSCATGSDALLASLPSLAVTARVMRPG
jgi:hypothetical protein